MKLALCIVGCGQFARTFVQGLQPVRDDLDLFFASRDMARARAYAALFQGRGAFGSYEAAAADPRVEAMYLCTPHHLHQAHVVLVVLGRNNPSLYTVNGRPLYVHLNGLAIVLLK
jgi:predicted dehydrogenase